MVSGCGSLAAAPATPTAAFTATIEASPTVPVPTATFTAEPSATVVPTATVDPDGGMFTPEQKQRLYQASLKYLAPTDDDAVRVAQALGFVQGGDPSNMCGPLAIKILSDAGFVAADVDLKNFWLLDPREKTQRAFLDGIFPPASYQDYHFDQPINQFDFDKFPLRTGDFLYLYAGGDGFEHMLTVTRVDEAGRVYSVTNYVTDQVYFAHFAIQEVMLYDPAQPGVGKFFDWTDEKNYALGLTGLGGFEVWRRNVPLTNTP
jgi:hypothetical protein